MLTNDNRRKEISRNCWLLIYLCFLIAGITTNISVAGSIKDTFDDNEINEKLWSILEYSSTAKIEEKGGYLHMWNLSDGWDGIGVRFVQPIDLTKGALKISFETKSGNSENLCSMNHVESKGDPWSDTPMSEWYNTEGKWEFSAPEKGHSVDPPFSIRVDQEKFHKCTIILTPTKDSQEYDFHTLVDDGATGETKGKFKLNGGDPTTLYLYFNVCQNGGSKNEGNYFDNIFIESPSVMGSEALNFKGKLASTWADIKIGKSII